MFALCPELFYDVILPSMVDTISEAQFLVMICSCKELRAYLAPILEKKRKRARSGIPMFVMMVEDL